MATSASTEPRLSTSKVEASASVKVGRTSGVEELPKEMNEMKIRDDKAHSSTATEEKVCSLFSSAYIFHEKCWEFRTMIFFSGHSGFGFNLMFLWEHEVNWAFHAHRRKAHNVEHCR